MQQSWNGLTLPLWDEVLQDPEFFQLHHSDIKNEITLHYQIYPTLMFKV